MTSMKETGQYPRPVAHSRVKTPKTYPVHADRRRSIVACPMSLGARVTQTRETREPDRRSGAVTSISLVSDRFWLRGARRRDAQRRERERELISLRPQCMCAQARVGREGVGLLVLVRCSWHVVVDVSLSLSPLTWSAGLYPSFPVLVRRWARICEVLRGCRPPSYRASHHSGWVTPVGTRCGICARCRRSPSLRRAASNRPQPHQRTSRWARRTGSTRVARPPRARA